MAHTRRRNGRVRTFLHEGVRTFEFTIASVVVHARCGYSSLAIPQDGHTHAFKQLAHLMLRLFHHLPGAPASGEPKHTHLPRANQVTRVLRTGITALRPWPAGSCNSQPMRRCDGMMGHWSPQPIVTTTSTLRAICDRDPTDASVESTPCTRAEAATRGCRPHPPPQSKALGNSQPC